MILKNSAKTLSVLIIRKIFELHKRAFFRDRKYQMKMKETFDRRKVHKEIDKFQIGELVWFNIQRQIPDMKYNKAKWIGHRKVGSVLHMVFRVDVKGDQQVKSSCIYIYNLLKGFVENFLVVS